jgi:hypothetical protein
MDAITWVEQTVDHGYIFTGFSSLPGQYFRVWLTKTNPQGDTMWTRFFGNNIGAFGYCVEPTSDGGYIITGAIHTGTGPPNLGDVCLIKTDPKGHEIWRKIYDGQVDDSLSVDWGWSVLQTVDGGYLVAAAKGHHLLWLIKTDQNGDSLWTKTYDFFCQIGALQQTSDNGYIIITNGGWLIKTDNFGDTLWTRNYSLYDLNDARDIRETQDGGFIITGNYIPYLNFSHMVVIKTDAVGQHQWDFKLQFPESDKTEGHSVLQCSNGYFSVAGINEGPYGQSGTYLLKIDRGKMITGFRDRTPAIHDFYLWQNYPNPFNPSTVISWRVPSPAQGGDGQLAVSNHVTLTVYNLAGQKVATLVDENKKAGNHSIQFDGSDLASGIYLYRLQAGDFVETRKMVLMK